MTGCGEDAVGGDKHIVPKGHPGTVQDSNVMIRVKIFPDGDIETIIAGKRCRDDGRSFQMSYDLLQ